MKAPLVRSLKRGFADPNEDYTEPDHGRSLVMMAKGKPGKTSGQERGPDDPVHDPRDPAYMLPKQKQAQARRNRQRTRKTNPDAPGYSKFPLSQVPTRRA